MIAGAFAVLAAAPAGADGVHIEFVPSQETILVGDTITVEARVFAADEEFNAFDLIITFDDAVLDFVATTPINAQRGELMTQACANTFHIFTPGMGQLSATLSLLCANTFVTGPGVIYRVRFAARTPAVATAIACGPGTQFYRAGFSVSPLECLPADLTVMEDVTGVEPEAGAPAGPPEDGAGAARLAPQPNPFRGDGVVRFVVTLGARAEARVDIHDVSGRLVGQTSPVRALERGETAIPWEPDTPLASGTYFVRLVSAGRAVASATWVVVR